MVVLMVVMVFNVAMEDGSAAKALPSATATIEKTKPSTRMRRESMRFSSIFVLLGYVHTILRDQSSAFSCREKRRFFIGDGCHDIVAMLSMFRCQPRAHS
jgi:hypothetical protein